MNCTTGITIHDIITIHRRTWRHFLTYIRSVFPFFFPLFSKITSRFNIGQYNTSNSRLHKGVTVKSQESLLSTVNNTNEARDMLAKRILNPVQRRRTRSVGLPEENGEVSRSFGELKLCKQTFFLESKGVY